MRQLRVVLPLGRHLQAALVVGHQLQLADFGPAALSLLRRLQRQRKGGVSGGVGGGGVTRATAFTLAAWRSADWTDQGPVNIVAIMQR